MKNAVLKKLYRPMLATLAARVEGGDFVYEIKWDGVRAITYIDDGKMFIRSRNDLNCMLWRAEKG
jgi:bifunctional non-homologous end joining protein LigD